MSEMESAHGKLSKVDQEFNGPKFLMLLVITLAIAFAIIYFIAGVKSGDFTYSPFAHDPIKHVLEHSSF